MGKAVLPIALACAGLLAPERGVAPIAHADETVVASESPEIARVLARARLEVERGVDYDPSYRVLTFVDGIDTGKKVYPNGDLDPYKGVCADVVVRAFRAAGADLQRLLHDDIVAAPKAYPSIGYPDPNIDQRRVVHLMKYFDRHAKTLSTSVDGAGAIAAWKPGDVVIWSFRACPKCSPDHVGIVGDRLGPRGLPLVLHNVGPHPTEDDVLDAWVVLRHVRLLQ